MESTWSAQPARSLSQKKAANRIAHSQRLLAKTGWLSWGALIITVGALGLKLHKVLIRPDMTVMNTSLELVIALLGVVCVGVSLVYWRRARREWEALGEDTTRCLSLMIRRLEKDIRDMRKQIPAILGLFAVLIILAKWQSIHAGFEDPSEWVFVALVIAGMIGMITLMRHHMRHVLIPKLGELKRLKHELVNDSH